MWHAAGSESSVAPHMLQTILLILKGKPGQTQDSPMEKRRFSMDAANMMPVVVNHARLCPFPSHKHPRPPAWRSPALSVHSPHTHLLSVHREPCLATGPSVPVRDTDKKAEQTAASH